MRSVSPYIVTNTRSSFRSPRASAMSFVGNGRKATTKRRRRLMRSSIGSARTRRSVIEL